MPKNYYDEDDEDEEEEKEDKITWIKEPKWNEIFGSDFMENFDMGDFEEIIKKFMKQFNFPLEKKDSDGPVVWGFSMSMGPDKKPRIKPFGNISPRGGKKLLPKHRDSLVDIIDSDNEIIILAEILDVNESDIALRASEKNLKISVDTPKQKYFNEVTLPCKVFPKSARIRYQNGILEVKLDKKLADSKRTFIQID